MERLTERNEKGLAYLKNVKPNEQEVESPYPNTLRCILDCFEGLAKYEDVGLTPDEINQLKDENADLKKINKQLEFNRKLQGELIKQLEGTNEYLCSLTENVESEALAKLEEMKGGAL